MSPRRIHRLLTAFVTVLSLLLSQLALASYACPQQASADAMAALMEAGVPCHDMDPQQPALCHQHAADPGQVFEAMKLPVVSIPALVQVLELPLALQSQHAMALPPAAVLQAQPPPAAVFLSTLRLRV